jgi:hypothetical protein
LVVNQEWERDPTLRPESLSIVQITKPDGRQSSTFGPECRFVITQLRDVLAAEDSAVVAKERNHRWPPRP